MKTLNIDLGDRSYPIHIGSGLLGQDLIERHLRGPQVMVVTNEVVAPLYLDQVMEGLGAEQKSSLILPDGEQHKNLATVEQIFDALLRHRFGRTATLVALGGGVVGDIVGFAAACYQRGIPFIQIPTTLLAQVDSSVGGKTGVNHPLGKNMIGAFYQPQAVIADIDVLNSLPERELKAGIAEVIKYGLIRDESFFRWLEEHIESLLDRRSDELVSAIETSCRNKAEVVARDERESGLRAILNFGHTFAHAIETGMGYGCYLHGEAVAIGMCQAADLSRRLGLLNPAEAERVVALIERSGLPIIPPEALDTERFLALMAVDKKNVDGALRVILLETIGRATLPRTVPLETLRATLDEYGRESA